MTQPTPPISALPHPVDPVPDLLATVLAMAGAEVPPSEGFALLRRRGRPGVDVLVGEVVDVELLADLPVPERGAPPVLALVPFRQVRERGFECHDDGTPLRCLVARAHRRYDLADVAAALPDEQVRLSEAAFDVDDDTYADMVKRVIADEIGHGQGANFVVRRDVVARLTSPSRPARAALALLRRLLDGEPGAYWTFAVCAGDVTMVGATPERHVSVERVAPGDGDEGADGLRQVVMNPISGTFRYPPSGPTHEGVLRFLADPKETEELSMVVDEELKMMSEVCDRGGRVLGPRLLEMSRLAHTEYELVGRTDRDVRDVLRATMFAATVTGSPVENACRVVSRYEGRGRGYYSGVTALLTNEAGTVELDAPILIRTAYLAPDGVVRVPVGATLVRHSVAENEVAETHVKAAGLLAAFGVSTSDAPPVATERRPRGHALVGRLAGLPGVQEAMLRRNDVLSRFWLDDQSQGRGSDADVRGPVPELAGRTAVVVDAEDAWTAMLAHVLRHLGMSASVVRWDDVPAAGFGGALESADLVVAGPGPGDPRDLGDPRIAYLHMLLADRLAGARPTLAVCLSHQVLAHLLGVRVAPLPQPYQGTQRTVRVFGRDAAVGFYNTYSAWLPSSPPSSVHPSSPAPLEPRRDHAVAVGANGHAAGEVTAWAVPGTGEVLALEGPAFTSVQFHLESVLSADGVAVLASVLPRLLRPVS